MHCLNKVINLKRFSDQFVRSIGENIGLYTLYDIYKQKGISSMEHIEIWVLRECINGITNNEEIEKDVEGISLTFQGQ
jgi:hypothetical protein